MLTVSLKHPMSQKLQELITTTTLITTLITTLEAMKKHHKNMTREIIRRIAVKTIRRFYLKKLSLAKEILSKLQNNETIKYNKRFNAFVNAILDSLIEKIAS
jgi:hypothetical protein